MIYQCTEERFLSDVSKHQMTILRDDGLNKHIRFKKENGSSYWFDIITYSGRLIIDGDCGTFVFARIEDMMDFFRTKKNDWNYNKDGLSINPSYWGEKLRAVSNRGYGKGNIKEFSMDIFKAHVKEYYDRHFEDEIKGDADAIAEVDEDSPLSSKELADIEDRKIRRDEIWGEIESDILNYPDNEYSANQAAYDFDEQGFQFVDFHEYDCHEYTFEYIWNCYAVAMCVKMYDAHKLEQSNAVPS